MSLVTKVKLKRSDINISPTSLDYGEIAYNAYRKELYIGDTNNSFTTFKSDNLNNSIIISALDLPIVSIGDFIYLSPSGFQLISYLSKSLSPIGFIQSFDSLSNSYSIILNGLAYLPSHSFGSIGSPFYLNPSSKGGGFTSLSSYHLFGYILSSDSFIFSYSFLK